MSKYGASPKRTTIADIARELQVSLHTVNKALHGKKGVGDELRAKILQTAKLMEYRVNRVAQSMARKTLVVGVLSHATHWRVVKKPFLEGIKGGLDDLRDYNVVGSYYEYHDDEGFDRVVDQVADDGVSVVICLHCVPNKGQAERWGEAGIPFALLGTDGLEGYRLTSVRADSITAGRLAAQLMGLALPEAAKVVAFTGVKGYRDHDDKIAGFGEEIERHGLKLGAVYEHFDHPDVARVLVDKAYGEWGTIDGVYIATANGVSICERVKHLGERPLIVATDLYDDIQALMEQGVIAATIYQNAAEQGRKVIEMLYGHLCEQREVAGQVLIRPTLLLPAAI